MNAKVGMYAGDVWTALNQNGELDVKELKKAAKLKTEKDLYLALGWLLREDKLVVAEDGKTMKAIWQSDNFSYSIMVRGQGDLHDTFGLGPDDTAALVKAVQ